MWKIAKYGVESSIYRSLPAQPLICGRKKDRCYLPKPCSPLKEKARRWEDKRMAQKKIFILYRPLFLIYLTFWIHIQESWRLKAYKWDYHPSEDQDPGSWPWASWLQALIANLQQKYFIFSRGKIAFN